MSWGTDFTPDVFLTRKVYSSKGVLEDDIKELESDLIHIEKKINMYATLSPKDFEFNKEQFDNVVDAISYEVDLLMESHNHYSYELFLLRLYLEYINDNNIDLTKNNQG